MERTLNYVLKTVSLKTAGVFFLLKRESREPATDSHFLVQYIMFQAKQSSVHLLICCMKGTLKLDSQVGEIKIISVQFKVRLQFSDAYLFS